MGTKKKKDESSEEETEEDSEEDSEEEAPKKKAKGKPPPKKSPAKKPAPSSDEDEDSESEDDTPPPKSKSKSTKKETPKAKSKTPDAKKSSKKKAKDSSDSSDSEEEQPPKKTPSKKTPSKGDEKTPSKRRTKEPSSDSDTASDSDDDSDDEPRSAKKRNKSSKKDSSRDKKSSKDKEKKGSKKGGKKEDSEEEDSEEDGKGKSSARKDKGKPSKEKSSKKKGRKQEDSEEGGDEDEEDKPSKKDKKAKKDKKEGKKDKKDKKDKEKSSKEDKKDKKDREKTPKKEEPEQKVSTPSSKSKHKDDEEEPGSPMAFNPLFEPSGEEADATSLSKKDKKKDKNALAKAAAANRASKAANGEAEEHPALKPAGAVYAPKMPVEEFKKHRLAAFLKPKVTNNFFVSDWFFESQRNFLQRQYLALTPEESLRQVGHKHRMVNQAGMTMHHSEQCLSAMFNFILPKTRDHGNWPDRYNTLEQVRTTQQTRVFKQVSLEVEPKKVCQREHWIDTFDGGRIRLIVHYPSGYICDSLGKTVKKGHGMVTDKKGVKRWVGVKLNQTTTEEFDHGNDETEDVKGKGHALSPEGESNTYRFRKQHKPRTFETIPPAMLWLGGFVGHAWHIQTNTAVCAADWTECVVIKVEFRLAPEHKFPTALYDVEAAYLWVVEHAEQLGIDATRIGIGGENAGASMAAAVCIKIRDEQASGKQVFEAQHSGKAFREVQNPATGDTVLHPAVPMPKFQFLLNPFMDMMTDHPSFNEFMSTKFGFVEPDVYVHCSKLYTGTGALLRHPWVSPGLTESVEGLPPSVIITGGFDPFRDASAAFKDRLIKAKIHTRWSMYPGMLFNWFRHVICFSPEGSMALKASFNELNKLLEYIDGAGLGDPADSKPPGPADDAK